MVAVAVARVQALALACVLRAPLFSLLFIFAPNRAAGESGLTGGLWGPTVCVCVCACMHALHAVQHFFFILCGEPRHRFS